MINEYKEFFLREETVLSGDKADQEVNIPTTSFVTTCKGKEKKYNRLLPTHYPTLQIMYKFLSSITFKLNPEDTATSSTQGLVKMATDNAAATNVKGELSFSEAISPHQLPTIISNNGTIAVQYKSAINTYSTLASAIASGEKFHKEYILPTTLNRVIYNKINYPNIQKSNNLQTGITKDNAVLFNTADFKIDDSIKYTFKYSTVSSGSNSSVINISLFSIASSTTTQLYTFNVTSAYIGEITVTMIKRTSDFLFFIEDKRISTTGGTSKIMSYPYFSLPAGAYELCTKNWTDTNSNIINEIQVTANLELL